MAQEPERNVAVIGRELERVRDRIGEFLPANIPGPKFMNVVKTAIRNNPDLQECTPKSVILACEKAAADGLVLDGREAALVVFNKRENVDGKWIVVAREAQYIPMVAGMRRRIYNSGLVATMETRVVYAGEISAGLFEYEAGSSPSIVHKPLLIGDLGEEVAVYSVVTMANGHKSIEVMRWSEVMKIAKSQSKNVAYADDAKKKVRKGDLIGIWAQHTHEMARKTVLRRHSKQLPFDSDTARMFERVDALYQDEGREIDHTDTDGDEAAQATTPAAGRKAEGAGRAALQKARQERAATSSTPSEPERQEDVEDAEIVDETPDTGTTATDDSDDRI